MKKSHEQKCAEMRNRWEGKRSHNDPRARSGNASRQRLWQLRQMEIGNCIICGNLAALTTRRHAKRPRSVYCEMHKAMVNAAQLKRKWAKRAGQQTAAPNADAA